MGFGAFQAMSQTWTSIRIEGWAMQSPRANPNNAPDLISQHDYGFPAQWSALSHA